MIPLRYPIGLCLFAIAFIAAFTATARAAEPEKFTTDAAGFIPYWLGLGPIPVSRDEAIGGALQVDYLSGRKTVLPVAGDKQTINQKDYQWQPVTSQKGGPSVALTKALGDSTNAVYYLVSYLVSNTDLEGVVIRYGSSHSAVIYVNGDEVSSVTGKGTGEPDSRESDKFALVKGINVIMVKATQTEGDALINLRLVNADDKALANFPIAAAPEGKTAPAGMAWAAADTGPEKIEGIKNTYLVASQVGYNTIGEKLAIAASEKPRTWSTITICDAKTGAIVFTIPKDGGEIQPPEMRSDVNQNISRIYFGAFNKSGRYFLNSDEFGLKSYPFNIADNVFVDAANAVTKMFFYQRNGQAFDKDHAGKWAGPAYHDPAPAQAAQVCEWAGGNWLNVGDKVLDDTKRDVHGGWYDAGDPNKYTKNECTAHNTLLLTYDMNKAYMKDGDENIPESGNNIPDIVDETRYTTEYLMRIQRDDGAVFDRVAHGDDPHGRTAIAEPCSGATMCAAGSLAWAGAVWQEGRWDNDFAKKCIAAAEKSWTYMNDHPAPWPLKKIGSIDGGYGDETAWKIVAASALYRATGKDEYKTIVENYLQGLGNLRLGFNGQQIWICHNYMLSKVHDDAIVADFGKKLAGDATALRDDVVPTAKKHSYGAGNRDGYYWGSNSAVCRHAWQMAWWAWKFAPEDQKKSFDQAAQEYFQYILGRNPTRYCFITSLQNIGCENSVPIMFSFLCRGDNNDPDNRWKAPTDAHPNRTGCYPGYLVGGPTGSITGFGFNPDSISFDYEHMEPSIIYQCDAAALANYCAYLGRDYRK